MQMRACFFMILIPLHFSCRTTTFKGRKEEQCNPHWFEMLTVPFQMPTFSENLQVVFSRFACTKCHGSACLPCPQIFIANYRSKPTKHEMVGTLNFKLKDITANPARYGQTAVWCVVHCNIVTHEDRFFIASLLHSPIHVLRRPFSNRNSLLNGCAGTTCTVRRPWSLRVRTGCCCAVWYCGSSCRCCLLLFWQQLCCL